MREEKLTGWRIVNYIAVFFGGIGLVVCAMNAAFRAWPTLGVTMLWTMFWLVLARFSTVRVQRQRQREIERRRRHPRVR